jgi:hypothetical protein
MATRGKYRHVITNFLSGLGIEVGLRLVNMEIEQFSLSPFLQFSFDQAGHTHEYG